MDDVGPIARFTVEIRAVDGTRDARSGQQHPHIAKRNRAHASLKRRSIAAGLAHSDRAFTLRRYLYEIRLDSTRRAAGR